MKRVLITGGSGFVGANLARRVLSDGHETHLMAREPCQSWRLDEIAADVCLHVLSLEDRGAVRRMVSEVKPDWVFHLAAYGAYSTQTGFERMATTNLMGCVTLLDACQEIGVEAFVQTGSSSEYGYKDHPAAEDELLAPNSHYAITKAAATHYCQFTARQRDIHAVTVRLYSIYGPYEEPTRLIPTLIVLGLEGKLPPLVSPKTARDFVYVDEAVEAIIRVASHTTLPRGSVYNICTGQQSSLEFVVSTVRGLFGITAEPAWSSMPQRSWDTDVWLGSPTTLERCTGWHASVNVETGIKNTVTWLRQESQRLCFYARQIESALPLALSGRKRG
jgi:dolichol-phosphate mannosyltransferase